MIDHNTPVTEDELHVYVDGELPADRRDAVEAWLSSHPEDAARVAAWRAQAEAIRARYGDVVNEPVPDRLTLKRIMRKRRSWGAIAAAAAVAAFVIGGVAGWMARGASAAAPSEVELFTAEALGAHKLYIGEVRHPIEVKAEENHLLPWLSRRVGTTLRAPDLGGVRPQAAGRTAAARHQRAGGAVHVRKRERRALHDLLLAARRAANGVSLQRQRQVRRGALDRGRLWLGGERPDRQGAAEEHRQRRLRPAREPHAGARRAARPISSYRGADRRACRRATCASAPRARRRRARAARCARWHRGRPRRPCAAGPCP